MRLWLSVVGLFLVVTSALAQRAIPDDNLAYPVLIKIGTGNGSGFFLHTATSGYLVTAKHVFFDPATGNLRADGAELISYAKDPKDQSRNVLKLDLIKLRESGDLITHPSEDVAVAKLTSGNPLNTEQQKDLAARWNDSVEVKESSPSGLLSADLSGVKKFDEVLTGNDIVLFGYPNSIGLGESPQLDPMRPLLRKGIVAGLNPAKKSIVVDCPSYPGNSGGPVLQIERQLTTSKFEIIGVVIEYVPFVEAVEVARTPGAALANSGYSIVAPMDFVLELIK
jgi:hypothetical protein